mgnify:CR=1 FL=1
MKLVVLKKANLVQKSLKIFYPQQNYFLSLGGAYYGVG